MRPRTPGRELQGAIRSTPVAFIVYLFCSTAGSSVNVAQIRVPPKVKNGETVELNCDFNLGTQSLYSLNWWKGNQQFYQFSPSGDENKVVYDTPGVDVVLPKSDLRRIVLRNVTQHTSGQYKCEIVADFPSYARDSLSAPMEVVEVPRSQPVISLRRIQYSIGEILNANCTSSGTRPPSELVWYINGKRIQRQYTKLLSSRHQNSWMDDVLEDSPGVIHIGDVDTIHSLPLSDIPQPPIQSSITLALRPIHFNSGGRTVLACSATLSGVYQKSTQVKLTLPGVSPVAPSQRVSQGQYFGPPSFVLMSTLCLCALLYELRAKYLYL